MGYTQILPTYVISEETPFYIVFGDHTRSFNIVNTDFCVMDNVKILKPLQNYTLRELIFIISSWKNGIVDKGYSRHWSIAKEVKIQLPTKDGKIDFEFMDACIRELEEERIRELEEERGRAHPQGGGHGRRSTIINCLVKRRKY